MIATEGASSTPARPGRCDQLFPVFREHSVEASLADLRDHHLSLCGTQVRHSLLNELALLPALPIVSIEANFLALTARATLSVDRHVQSCCDHTLIILYIGHMSRGSSTFWGVFQKFLRIVLSLYIARTYVERGRPRKP